MEYTPQEQRNLGVVKEYMELSYNPKRASAAAVKHLVAEGGLGFHSAILYSRGEVRALVVLL